eukprot:Phypoly_transcript_24623.p1 GENE.Phypoly_transcript_24623~~Phypoly_transcript_24623.p1  ORF type:complete len:106 (-),score=3.70 Phypoly_transcript_24623:114-431(-)
MLKMNKELALGDNLLGLAGIRPGQCGFCTSICFEVLENHGVILPLNKVDSASSLARSLDHPPIHDLLVTYVQPRSVIGRGIESVGTTVPGLHYSKPLDRELVDLL